MAVHIGTSGWSYDHWDGVVYPPGLPQRERLRVYVRRFATVEINSTFYRWPRDERFGAWRARLPDDFLMSVKAPRGLTHGARLYAPEAWNARIERGIGALGDRFGVLLVQLPPTLAYDYARLAYFLADLPKRMRVAVELRHPSWDRPAIWALLERAGAAYCVMSGARLPCILRATAPFVYVRLHGPDATQLYGGSYADDDLRWWAERIDEWRHGGHEVFAYFNNDGGGNAVRNADTLRQMLGVM